MSTPQEPLPSGFGFDTTAADIVEGQDLTGRTILVTGGSAGLGLEAVRVLADAGATVIAAVRDPAKAAETLAPLAGVETEQLDLANPASIDAFADRFLATDRPLHVLINNAGFMAAPFARDGRGIESHFATNHLGHFQLTQRLWPALTRAGGARVISLTSLAHRFSGVDFEDPSFTDRPYEKWSAYAQSVSAKSLFAVALDARGRNFRVRSFAVHPGTIPTGIGRHLSLEDLQGLGAVDEHGQPVDNPTYKSVPQGAATMVWAAVSPQLDGHGGVYTEDADIAVVVPDDHRGPSGVHAWAVDPQAADRLWELSERLLGRSFTI
ncbi:SDR family NAD(P)-dependent oxidoreductase [Arthrobacter frigidicola]|nr:SDR family NAD(P)-dependent oxidoreductase [Arthrobacter frigidicola]